MDSSVATVSAEKVAEGRERILAELRKVIVGQDEVVEQVLIALFTGGHCLITGVPGLAKTLLIKTLADILDLDFKRIQFTPDLMPSDITGTEILDEEQGTRRLRFVKGPIFAQIILADEINRTPPKTQAALLEAMQEYHVTAAGPDLSARPPVLRARDAEPDRARRHLSAARSAARSLHVQRRHHVPERRRRGDGRDADDRRRPAGAAARAERAGHPAVPGAGAAGGDRRGDRALHRAAGRRVAAGRAGRAGVHRQVGEVGRRPARLAGAGARRQGARADARPLSRVDQGHPGAGEADPAPPDHDELLRGVGADQLRRDHRPADRDRCRCPRAGCKPCRGPRTTGRSSTPRSSRASARSS